MAGGGALRTSTTGTIVPRSCPSPRALAAALECRPPSPVALAGVLDGRSGAPGFRRLVETIFPEAAAAILAAERPGMNRAGARVAAFLERVEAELFPVYELDEWWHDNGVDPYETVLRGIPFVRMGWGDEDLHELARRDGQRLLLALCQHPYFDDDEVHLALLESLAPLVPLDTLLQLPRGGIPPETLHRRLDGGRFAAAAEFGDWLWGGTGTAFLDYDDTMDIVDADWTPEIVADLAEQWRRADAMLNRIDELVTWLEGDPPARFAELLRAALRPASMKRKWRPGSERRWAREPANPTSTPIGKRPRMSHREEGSMREGLMAMQQPTIATQPSAARRARQTPAKPPSSPYQRAVPPELEVEEDPLRLRLDFHDESVILHDYGGRGVATTRLVSALDVAHALASELDLTTGLLPPDALWLVKRSSGIWLALWQGPGVHTVRLKTSLEAPPRRFRLPLPGLVFLCAPGGQAPYVFAARARPQRPEEELFHAPFYNVFASGRVCVGTHAFPHDPARVPQAFFESFFSVAMDTARGKSRRHPEDIGRLWAELDRGREFPLDDLVPQFTVADAMRLGPGERRP